ncbi:hypothetical protein AZA_89199 [Nitrospirillum viridazoti Y2]|nr:hypothetical protein AZA_89199 [Nitrospirillum amazonense Y2]
MVVDQDDVRQGGLAAVRTSAIQRAIHYRHGPQQMVAGLNPARGLIHRHAAGHQVMHQDQAVDGGVVHHQGAAATQAVAQGLDRAAGRYRPFQRDVEPEGGTVAGRALHPYAAPHQLHQLAADGQAQAGAAEAAGDGTVGLLEHLEQPARLRRVDADAGVLHGDAQAPRLFRQGGRVAQQLDVHRHRALGRELDSVAHQVQQHLAHAGGIAPPHAHGALVHQGADLQPLVAGLGPQDGQGTVHQLIQVELDAFQADLACLQLRDVQNVVDDPQQGVGVVADDFGISALLGGQRRVQQYLRHAGDAVHGGADFVAHVGQEVRLGGVGPLRHLPGFFRRAPGAVQVAGQGQQALALGVQLAVHQVDAAIQADHFRQQQQQNDAGGDGAIGAGQEPAQGEARQAQAVQQRVHRQGDGGDQQPQMAHRADLGHRRQDGRRAEVDQQHGHIDDLDRHVVVVGVDQGDARQPAVYGKQDGGQG